MLTGLGLDVAGSRPGERCFTWSTDLDGVFESDHVDWKAGGASLLEYISPSLCQGARIAPADTTVICHSHGLQPVLYALASGLLCSHLVSVASPIRADMQAVTKLARANVKTWTHLYDPDDPVQVFGEDGLLCTRDCVQADANISIPNMGHTGAFDPEYAFRWKANGQWLR